MVDAIPALTKPDVIALYEKFNIFTKAELESRAEVQYENYVSKIGIEAKCAIHMAGKHYIPAGIKFSSTLAQSYAAVSAAGVDASVQKELLERVSALTKQAQDALSALITACDESDAIENAQELAQAYLTTYRSGDWWDFVANSIGVVIGVVLGLAMRVKVGGRDNKLNAQ